VQRGLRVETEKARSLMYKGNGLDCGDRLDLLVERSVIVGLLINFNVRLLRDGLRRLVLDLPE
jgi:hypothetical protein